MPLARITVTVPHGVLKDADRRARALDRSRSWVVAEALRRYLAGPTDLEPAAGASARVAEVPAAPYAIPPEEIESARLRHLASELALTPAERLARAEELGQFAFAQQRRTPRRQVISFTSYEDFERWKTARRIGV
jgi:hypothetical protein